MRQVAGSLTAGETSVPETRASRNRNGSERAGAGRGPYASTLVDRIHAGGGRLQAGDLTIDLAQEFGFCYGVDRAVAYAYQTRLEHPDRRVWLVGEIIHNPSVNERMREMGIGFLFGQHADGQGYEAVQAEDIVILPAFGIPMEDMERLRRIGCDLVDTTCGSVMLVWKNVQEYARDGFTIVIHGKFYHEETMATASRATWEGGHYLIIRDREEASLVAEYITGEANDREAFLERFRLALSPGFDPDVHLDKIGLANQTTMLKSESLHIAGILQDAVSQRWGRDEVPQRFRNYETICSATQERQDAILALLDRPLDLVIVIGGYNSSNTNNLAKIAAGRVTTYHIDSADGIRPDNVIRHKPVDAKDPIEKSGWLGAGPMHIGITAGASTPDSEIGETIARLLTERGIAIPGELTGEK
jgi:4-hydroxy-3-methylbut-2-enyl diphosphate reductase